MPSAGLDQGTAQSAPCEWLPPNVQKGKNQEPSTSPMSHRSPKPEDTEQGMCY